MCVFSCGSCVVGSVMLLRVAGLGMGVSSRVRVEWVLWVRSWAVMIYLGY